MSASQQVEVNSGFELPFELPVDKNAHNSWLHLSMCPCTTALHDRTSHACTADVFAQRTADFANQHIKDANERVVLTEPFDAACPNNCVIQDEQLAGLVADLRWVPAHPPGSDLGNAETLHFFCFVFV